MESMEFSGIFFNTSRQSELYSFIKIVIFPWGELLCLRVFFSWLYFEVHGKAICFPVS